MTLVGGKLAMQAFFVGFYMSLILNEKYPATRSGNLLFYGNRFLRIYPNCYLGECLLRPSPCSSRCFA